MVSRKIVIYVAYITLILVITSCGKLKNPKERNVITFKNNLDNVAFAIEKMNGILAKTKKNFFIYGVDGKNVLFIENSAHNIEDVGLLTDTTLCKDSLLLFIDTLQRAEFVQLANYLKENFITRCNRENGKYIYLYRDDVYMADRQEDLQRFIVFAKHKAEINDLLEDNFVNAAYGGKYNLAYKIIDQKGNLFLLAHKDAEIWEN